MKEINLTVDDIAKKLQKRDIIYHEIGGYLERISSVSKRTTAEEKAIRAKILQIKASSENEVDSKKVGDTADTNGRGFAKGEAPAADKGGIKNLEERLKHHQHWHGKLRVSAAFLNEKKELTIE